MSAVLMLMEDVVVLFITQCGTSCKLSQLNFSADTGIFINEKRPILCDNRQHCQVFTIGDRAGEGVLVLLVCVCVCVYLRRAAFPL